MSEGLSYVTQVGHRLYIHATATGKARRPTVGLESLTARDGKWLRKTSVFKNPKKHRSP